MINKMLILGLATAGVVSAGYLVSPGENAAVNENTVPHSEVGSSGQPVPASHSMAVAAQKTQADTPAVQTPPATPAPAVGIAETDVASIATNQADSSDDSAEAAQPTAPGVAPAVTVSSSSAATPNDWSTRYAAQIAIALAFPPPPPEGLEIPSAAYDPNDQSGGFAAQVALVSPPQGPADHVVEFVKSIMCPILGSIPVVSEITGQIATWGHTSCPSGTGEIRNL